MTATVEVVTQDVPGGVLKPQGDYKGRPAAERQARKLRDTKSFHAVGVRIRGICSSPRNCDVVLDLSVTLTYYGLTE